MKILGVMIWKPQFKYLMFHEGGLQDATQSSDKRFMSECQMGFLFWVLAKNATQLKTFLVDGVAGWT